MKLFRLLITGSVICALCLLVGCRTLSSGIKAEAPDVDKSLLRLHEQASGIWSVQAESSLEFRKGKQHERVELIWIVQKPAKAYFELLSPIGMLAVATIDGREFRYFNAREKVAVTGLATPERLGEILPWPMRPAELVPLLCGTPIIAGGIGKAPQYDEENGRWKVVRGDPEGQWLQTLWLEDDGGLFRLRQTERGVGIRFQVTYMGWQSGPDGMAFPGSIKLEHPRSKTTVMIRTKKHPLINAEIDPGTFLLPLPENVPVRRMN